LWAKEEEEKEEEEKSRKEEEEENKKKKKKKKRGVWTYFSKFFLHMGGDILKKGGRNVTTYKHNTKWERFFHIVLLGNTLPVIRGGLNVGSW
jgi:hypothetical protein